MAHWSERNKNTNQKLLSGASVLVALLLCVGATTATAQHVYRCTEGSKTVYSDRPCPNNAKASRINANANTIDRSEARAQHERDTWRLEREREYWAQEHQRQSSVAQQSSDNLHYEKERKEALRAATTVLPGSQGGLTRSQREAAAALVKTPQERADLMREATTVMPGSRGGLTASQLDTASRLYQSRQGRPMPPPAPYQDPPPPPAHIEPPEIPSQITTCDQAGCGDTAGRRLNNAAGGNFHRSDGKFCTRAGPNLICN